MPSQPSQCHRLHGSSSGWDSDEVSDTAMTMPINRVHSGRGNTTLMLILAHLRSTHAPSMSTNVPRQDLHFSSPSRGHSSPVAAKPFSHTHVRVVVVVVVGVVVEAVVVVVVITTAQLQSICTGMATQRAKRWIHTLHTCVHTYLHAYTQ